MQSKKIAGQKKPNPVDGLGYFFVGEVELIHKIEIDGTKIVLDVNSGAVHVMDSLAWEVIDDFCTLSKKEILTKYSQKYPLNEIEEVLQEIAGLQQNGLLYSRDSYEEKIFGGDDRFLVKSLCLNVSHDCNMRCRYCFAGSGNFGGTRSLMPLETGERAIDFLLKNCGARRHCEIDFFGGEPLINFETVRSLVSYGRAEAERQNKEIKFTLTTNALLLNDEVTDFLNRENISVVLSLDGRPGVNNAMRIIAGTGRGSYSVIRPKISAFVESRNNENYFVRGTFTRHNLDFSRDVLHLADLGYRYISVEPVVGPLSEEWSIKEEDLSVIFQEYETLVRDYIHCANEGRPFEFFHFNVDLENGPCLPKRLSGCGAGHEYMAVTPEGDLFPCHQFVGMAGFRLGSVWEGVVNMGLVSRFRNAHIYNKETCRKCWAKFHCGGGCHANAQAANKTILQPYHVGCELEKKRLECAIYLQVLRAGANEI